MYENMDRGKRNETIKLIAIISMTIDHIGAFLFPQYIVFRIIGRLAMPIFSFGVATGIKKSKNIEKYLLRLFIFALISQVPFNLVEIGGLSIIATIFLTALFLYLISRDKPLFYLLSVVPLILCIVVPMDYGVYFLLLSTIIYIFYDRPIIAFTMGSMITVLMSLNYYNNPMQLYSIIGLLIACVQYSKKVSGILPIIVINKYFFYIYYPLHLMVIYLIVQIT